MLAIRHHQSTPADYKIIWREGDSRNLVVGCIYCVWEDTAPGYWFWALDFFQRCGRAEPYEGRVSTEAQAQMAWIRCWQSATPPIHWPGLPN